MGLPPGAEPLPELVDLGLAKAGGLHVLTRNARRRPRIAQPLSRGDSRPLSARPAGQTRRNPARQLISET
jgi:hypothetical protein